MRRYHHHERYWREGQEGWEYDVDGWLLTLSTVGDESVDAADGVVDDDVDSYDGCDVVVDIACVEKELAKLEKKVMIVRLKKVPEPGGVVRETIERVMKNWDEYLSKERLLILTMMLLQMSQIQIRWQPPFQQHWKGTR